MGAASEQTVLVMCFGLEFDHQELSYALGPAEATRSFRGK